MADLNWPRLRKLLRAPEVGFNAEVYRHFRQDEDTPGRRALRDYLLIGATDSRTTAQSKIAYFRDQVQKVHLKPEIYGEPIADVDTVLRYKPEIVLAFSNRNDRSYSSHVRPRARVSYKIIDKTEETITETDLKRIANRINQEFVTGTLFKFEKGKELYTYKEFNKGYNFQVYTKNQTEAKRVIDRVMAINGDNPDWKFMQNHTPEEPYNLYPRNPGRKTILGRSVELNEKRPEVLVQFAFAYALLKDKGKPVALVDAAGRLMRPYIRA